MRLRGGKDLASADPPNNGKMAEKESSDHSHMHIEPRLEGDRANVMLLLLLYVLQGIPLGLAGSLPMVLQNKKISYKEQAMFSLVFWPFSLKLLWAPIVDAAYLKQFGRRKTWLVPTQYLIGAFMLMLSYTVDNILETEHPNVRLLTVIFFCLNFLAATQDIAVDGWALTMLKRHNVGYASTCNSVGQTAGYFLGNVVFLAFSSPEFCNHFFREYPQDVGLITLSSFLYFWGIVFVVVTSLVWLFKTEKSTSSPTDEPDLGIIETYHLLMKIVRLPAVMSFASILLTCKVGFAAADAVTGLKLIEAGVAKETLALIAVPMVPIQILLPLIISRFTSGPRPLDIFRKAMPYRLLLGVIFAVIVYWTRHIRPPGVEQFPIKYYMVILGVYALHQVTLYTMFVSLMSFNARISDPVIGGTYMTLLNTVSNLGGNWPNTLALWAVDGLTWKKCSLGSQGSCGTAAATESCVKGGGHCDIVIDGYYIESCVCIILGIAWLVWRKSTLTSLQNMKDAVWRVA